MSLTLWENGSCSRLNGPSNLSRRCYPFLYFGDIKKVILLNILMMLNKILIQWFWGNVTASSLTFDIKVIVWCTLSFLINMLQKHLQNLKFGPFQFLRIESFLYVWSRCHFVLNKLSLRSPFKSKWSLREEVYFLVSFQMGLFSNY